MVGWLGQKPSRKDGNSRTVFGRGRGAEKWGSSWMVIQELKKGLFCLLRGFFFSPLIIFIKHCQIYSKSEDKAQSSYITPPPVSAWFGLVFCFPRSRSRCMLIGRSNEQEEIEVRQWITSEIES